ncbi:flocculation-associated PEP-CTERM protein PepA [Aquincola sp. MAHUQ-54]|uniref:Flocculation-associated PEP-CTERM protein PepA n=1 Tax=Aquincola agrisoli TaxID=3119538 RepID=A0AAW9QI49_9BURK
MKMFKYAGAIAAATLVAGSAMAAPIFEVTPSALGYAVAPFNADKIDGGAAALLTLDAATQTVTGTGYVEFTSFALNNSSLNSGNTGLNIGGPLNLGYQMWTVFSYKTSYTGGGTGFGTAGSQYNILELSFEVYARPFAAAGNAVFNPGSPAGVAPSVSVGAGAQLVGTGLLDATGPNAASFNAAGGTSFNANSLFSLTAFGETVFTQPDPFYTNAFNSFTNTSTGFVQNGQFIQLTQATGSIDFAGQVPEPGSLALVGAALLGLAFARQRKGGKA